MNVRRVFPVFSVFFVLAYAASFVIADQALLPKSALFAYYPALAEFHWSPLGLPIRQTGPVMLWYGWIANATVAGLIAAGIALALPAGGRVRLWSVLVWTIPILAFLVLCWFERIWFLR
jgi:hypothetical protein